MHKNLGPDLIRNPLRSEKDVISFLSMILEGSCRFLDGFLTSYKLIVRILIIQVNKNILYKKVGAYTIERQWWCKKHSNNI